MLIKLLELFYTFFIIGLLTVGGGYAMIPMIFDNVIKNEWLTMEELKIFIAIGESTPGPFAVNTATLVGFSRISEFPVIGAIVTTLAVILPSFIITVIIAKHIENYLDKKIVRWIMTGVKATIVGLIFAVVITLLKENVFVDDAVDYISLLIFGIVFTIAIVFKRKVGPIPLIIFSGFLGFIFYWVI